MGLFEWFVVKIPTSQLGIRMNADPKGNKDLIIRFSDL